MLHLVAMVLHLNLEEIPYTDPQHLKEAEDEGVKRSGPHVGSDIRAHREDPYASQQ
jgi:hypothetical protein